MPRSRKHKLRRLESKYKSFNFRTIIAYLLVAFVLYVGGLSFSPAPKSPADTQNVSPLLHFAFMWTGFICIQLSGQFVMGSLRAQADKNFGALIWQLTWMLVFLISGVSVAVFGINGYLL